MAVIQNSVRFTEVPSESPIGTQREFLFTAEVKEEDSGKDLQAEVTAFLFVGINADTSDPENAVARTKTTVSQNTVVDGSLSHAFTDNRGLGGMDVTVVVFIDFFGDSGFSKEKSLGDVDGRVSATGTTAIVEAEGEQLEQDVFADDQGAARNSLQQSFEDSVPFKIVDIVTESDVTDPLISQEKTDIFKQQGVDQITFDEFPNPNVSIDGSGRFAKHEIIGGATVRQKIGEDPLNISINGVCNAKKANQIDALRDVRTATIISNRLPGSTDNRNNSEGGGSLRVQIGSTSTEPIEEGGGADFTTGELLYTYSINAIEVVVE